MTTDNARCPNCQSVSVEIFTRHNAASDGVSFLEELSRCNACDEQFYTYEQSMASSRAHAAAVRAAKGLPSPEVIQRTRVDLGMTQATFEQALGVGKKTVVRWERGTVPPSRAACLALWLARTHPDVFLDYARERHPDLVPPKDAKVIALRASDTSDDREPMVLQKTHGPSRKSIFKTHGRPWQEVAPREGQIA